MHFISLLWSLRCFGVAGWPVLSLFLQMHQIVNLVTPQVFAYSLFRLETQTKLNGRGLSWTQVPIQYLEWSAGGTTDQFFLHKSASQN